MTEQKKAVKVPTKETTKKVVAKETTKTEDKMVSVPEATILEMQAQIKKLSAVSDVGRLHRYEQIHEKEEIVPIVRLNLYKGQVILKWKMEQNISEVDPSGGRTTLKEQQTIRFWMEDESEVVVDYLEWHRKKYDNQILAEITGKKIVKMDPGEVKDPFKKHTTIYTTETKDGKEIDIDERYVN